ncbi:phage virion morphogenesis protein [Paracidovorax konjaci]|uniref:Phage virion morphogenesis (Putative tail completion) protein n=1 Tax=Paracidovorax konjaci TaxID=32040 RepID=A0A1I1XS99_9BURK|nr:phage virion morphogenesis protein [Paracidovorax konjaci]SFE10195.1 phage virion morphogenesis (putative tail completion) protein [Paracidovorax konjaci]
MADLSALETWAGDILAKLEPVQRSRLLVDVARRLRTANAQRMRAQQDPDGTAWEPRKPPGPALRSQRERVRQAAKQRQPMMAKLRQVRNLKAKGEAGTAVVEFAGRAERIARVHHFGEVDAVKPGGPRYQYPARPLLGITESDLQTVRDVVLRYLA